MHELGNFDEKVNVMLNGLEKYMAFTINNNLVFIGSMQFMNSSLDALVKNLSNKDFKYLLQEFGGDLLELVNQKREYPYDDTDSFKRFSGGKVPDKCQFYSS